MFGADGFTPLRGVDGETTFVNGISSDGRAVGVFEVPMSHDMVSPPKRELSFVTVTPVAASIPGDGGRILRRRQRRAPRLRLEVGVTEPVAADSVG